MQWFSFYEKYFNKLERRTKQNVKCIFHDDKEPSLSIDLETGLFYCHACKIGGDVFSFYMKHHQCSFSKAKQEILGNSKAPYLTETEVMVAHNHLLSSESLQQLLLIKRGWNLEIIKKYKLGWKDERVFIPIYQENILLNIRKYDILHKTKHKFIGVEGHNNIYVWPETSIQYEWIAIFAGEPDTILANQLGIPGVTFTSGEGTFSEALLPKFKEKKVYIVYDPDLAGKAGAAKLANALYKYTQNILIVNLPDKTGDFTELFLSCIENKINFITIWNPIIDNAIQFKPKEITTQEAISVDFYSAVHDNYFEKAIKFKAMAIGKNFSPYFAPKKLSAKCSFTRGDSCKNCKMFLTGGEEKIEIDEGYLLDLIKCPNNIQKDKIQQILGIKGCRQYELEIETQNIEEIYISPVIDSEKIDRQFIVRKCYSESHDIKLNKVYNFIGKTIPDAKTQEATHLFYKQIPELTDLDTFQLTPDNIEALKIFQPFKNTLEGITEKFSIIYKDLTYNIPELIIGREMLMLAYDLVFHSVLRFKFLNSLVEKGWVELLALGDTRTGKTKTALKMCKHYKVGEYITLESATIAGLVGGVTSTGRESVFSWGVLPINDGRLAILDEVNGLQTKDISNLSSIRDNGIAERTIVGSTRKTNSRVRLIWISNPRSNANISYYSTGVEAIRELIGRAEDIARYDFGIIIAKEDVNLMDINNITQYHIEHQFTSELCNKCVMWAWSRKEGDIHFTKEAEIAILKYAVEMSWKYSDIIPLVQGSVQRIKLAKLSVAVACRLFSTEDGINVIVKREHVDFVVNTLSNIYDSPYFGYEDFSKQKEEEGNIKEDVKIFNQLKMLPNKFAEKMLDANTILFDDIKDFSGLSRDGTSTLKSILVTNNCLKRKKSFYIKTPEFIKILKKIKILQIDKQENIL